MVSRLTPDTLSAFCYFPSLLFQIDQIDSLNAPGKEAPMRITGLLFFGYISFLSVSAARPADDKSKAEVNWARSVVLDLVEECQTARHVSSSAARGLLSPEFADSMRAADAASEWTVLHDLG
jgi:hypothetical protein